jgi:TM2 domain-containing membrane protein YozV
MNHADQQPPAPYVPGPNPGRPDLPPVPHQQHNQIQPWPSTPPMPYPAMQPMPIVKPKNPGAAAVLSFLFPGLGQIMNGDIALGIVMMVLVVFAWISLMFLIGIVLLPAMYLWSIIEAYTKAKRWNTAHGVLS